LSTASFTPTVLMTLISAMNSTTANTVVAVGPSDDVPLLAGKSLVDGRTAVYLCENFACQAPVTDAANLSERLTNP
jgi:uncharacterized protein YyaL (SSP411 family)